ncbi:hypothetical protein HDU76_010444, partial [Blyttiomyces sp. JEL0837]
MAYDDMDTSSKLSWREKIEQAKKTKSTSPASKYFWRNFVVWLMLTVGGVAFCLSGNYHIKKFNRGYADECYIYTAAAFAIAVVYSYIAYVMAKNAEKRQLASVLCAVNAVAMTSYLLQYLRLTPAVMDYVGHPQDPSRYLEWLATCPIL